MKIELKNTPEQVQLIKALGSKNVVEAAKAQEALAAFISDVARKVLPLAGTASVFYKDISFDEDDSPSIPLDLYYDEAADFVQTWSQTMAGGLPTSETSGISELKVSTYTLNSAVSFQKKYARKARLDVISKSIERMLWEVLAKNEKNGWAVVLKALAEASTNSLSHVIAAGTASQFKLADLSKLMTRTRRINTAFNGGTPAGAASKGLTDLFISPEMTEEIRSFAYNSQNTAQATSGTTSIPLPDGVREEIYRAAGTSEIFGVTLHEILELGVAQKYNVLFDQFYTPTFDPAADEVLVGVDMTRESALRVVSRQSETGNTFVVQPDDQWPTRADKAGFYGQQEVGHVVIDSRMFSGITV